MVVVVVGVTCGAVGENFSGPFRLCGCWLEGCGCAVGCAVGCVVGGMGGGGATTEGAAEAGTGGAATTRNCSSVCMLASAVSGRGSNAHLLTSSSSSSAKGLLLASLVTDGRSLSGEASPLSHFLPRCDSCSSRP